MHSLPAICTHGSQPPLPLLLLLTHNIFSILKEALKSVRTSRKYNFLSVYVPASPLAPTRSPGNEKQADSARVTVLRSYYTLATESLGLI